MGNPRVLFQTTQGDFTLELDEARAPKTVANFLAYVDSGHYSGTIFHRVIDGFMVQGGGFDARFEKKPTRAPVTNEADNGLLNEVGTVAMARTSDPHSASAQFFVNVAKNDFLNHKSKDASGWGYCVFGRVVAGMDVVDKVKKLKTGGAGPFAKDVPTVTVSITAARRL